MAPIEQIGKYEIVERIGEGGFGAVYAGRDPFIKRPVAVKVCTAASEELRQRFLREAEIVGNLHHPNIVTVFDFGTDEAGLYLVQEYLDGEDLKETIRRLDPIPARRRIVWLLQVARGLAYAHDRGVLHRDIKPGNLRVLPDDRVKILDFGIAKIAGSQTRLTEEGKIVGTAGYLSPEQLRGEELDGRTDVFSFGAVAYELLTYTAPFPGSTISELLRNVVESEPRSLSLLAPAYPDRLARLVHRCLAKNRDDRPDGFGPVVAELEAILDEPLPEAAPTGTADAVEASESHDDTRPAPSLTAPGDEPGGRAATPPPSLDATQRVPLLTRSDGDGPVPDADPPDTTAPETGAPETGAPDGHRQDEAQPDETPRQGAPENDATLPPPLPTTASGPAAAPRPATPPPPPPPDSEDTRPPTTPASGSRPADPRPDRPSIDPEAPPVSPASPTDGGLPRWLLWAVPAAIVALGIALVAVWLLWTLFGASPGPAEPDVDPMVDEEPTSSPVSDATPVLVEAVPWGTVVAIRRATAADGDIPESDIPENRDPGNTGTTGAAAEVLADVDGPTTVQPPAQAATPLLLELPPGTWIVEVTHPDAEEPGRCRVTVARPEAAVSGVAAPSEVTAPPVPCRVELVEPDVDAWFRQAGWWE